MRKGMDRMAIINRLKIKATDPGTKRLVFTKDRGIEKTVPITVPAKAMQRVSRIRVKSPSFLVEKKKMCIRDRYICREKKHL